MHHHAKFCENQSNLAKMEAICNLGSLKILNFNGRWWQIILAIFDQHLGNSIRYSTFTLSPPLCLSFCLVISAELQVQDWFSSDDDCDHSVILSSSFSVFIISFAN